MHKGGKSEAMNEHAREGPALVQKKGRKDETRNETTETANVVLVETALISVLSEDPSLIRLPPLGAEQSHGQPRNEDDAHFEATTSSVRERRWSTPRSSEARIFRWWERKLESWRASAKESSGLSGGEIKRRGKIGEARRVDEYSKRDPPRVRYSTDQPGFQTDRRRARSQASYPSSLDPVTFFIIDKSTMRTCVCDEEL